MLTKQDVNSTFTLALLTLFTALGTAPAVLLADLQPVEVAAQQLPARFKGLPYDRFLQTSDGNDYFYGYRGVFQFLADGTTRSLYSTTTYTTPITALAEGQDGALYGIQTTFYAEERHTPFISSMFRLTKAGEFTLLSTLSEQGSDPIGWEKIGENFYTIVEAQATVSTPSHSVLFKLTPGGVETKRTVPQELEPVSLFQLASDGRFYGATFGATSRDSGAIFQMNTAGEYTVLARHGAETIFQTGPGTFTGATGAREAFTFTSSGAFRLLTRKNKLRSSFLGGGGYVFGTAYDGVMPEGPRKILRVSPAGALDLIATLDDPDMETLGEDGGWIYLASGSHYFRLPAQPQPNTPPVAVADSALVGPTPAYIPVLRNDTDAENQILTIISVSRPAQGSAEISGQNIIYTAGASFHGEDHFSYTISDGRGGTASAPVTVRSWASVQGIYVLNLDQLSNYTPSPEFPPDRILGRVVLAITGPGTYSASGVFSSGFGTLRTAKSGALDATGQLFIDFETFPLTFFIGEGALGGIRAVNRSPNFESNTETVTEFHAQKPAPAGALAGRYTMTSKNSDTGNGWAVFTVRRNGLITLTGKAYRGKIFTSGAYLGPDQSFNFFAGGFEFTLGGKMHLLPATESDGKGDVVYQYGDTFGFANQSTFEAIASRYVPPAAKAPRFIYTQAGGLVKIILNGFAFSTIESTATLGNGDRAVVSAPIGSLVFQQSDIAGFPAGIFRGNVTLPGQTTPSRFSGVDFQKGNRAQGFVDGDLSGTVTILPQ